MPAPQAAALRRPRRSESETEQRMLSAALARIVEHGLSVGIDDLGFETIIEEADVSRSTAYRRWPSKEDFYAEVLIELAGHEEHGFSTFSVTDLPGLLDHVTAGPPPRDPGERRVQLVELCRRISVANYEHDRTRAQVRTLIALLALLESHPTIADAARAGLQRTDSYFRDLLAQVYDQIGSGLGFHPVPGMTWERVAALGSAALVGVMLQQWGRTDEEPPVEADPFGTGKPASWTDAALAYTAVVVALVESDEALCA